MVSQYNINNISLLIEKHKEILQLLTTNHNTKLVGGCVRDFLKYGIFAYDIDISTTLKPNEVKEILIKYQKNNKNKKTTILDRDEKYGTIVVLIDNQRYEITTTRADIDCFGRQAKVEFCEDFELDSKRRDFTINALYVGLDCKICDFHNGLEDLQTNTIRFIGDANKRIKEDFLRIVRFFRFTTKFNNFQFNSKIIDIIQKNKKSLLTLSRERIRNELWKLLSYKNWFEGLKSIENYSIISDLFLIKNYTTIDNKNNFFDNTNQANTNKLQYNNEIKYSEVVKLFYFFNYDFVILNEFFEKLKFTNNEKKFVLFLQKNWKCFDNFIKNKLFEMDLKKILYDTMFDNKQDYISSILSLFHQKQQEIILDFINSCVELPIKSSDLIKLGFTGKTLGEIIEKLTTKWIKSNFKATKNQLFDDL